MAERPGPLDPQRQALLEHLAAHRVEGVIIGGAAIQNYRPTYATDDVDFAPARDDENMRRLADALNGLDCRLVVDPADPSSHVALPPDYFTPASLSNARFWNLATRLGDLDVCFEPAGFPGGYEDLRGRASLQTIAGTTISAPVAALADVEHSKRTAGRSKDLSYFDSYPSEQTAGDEVDELRRIRSACYPQDPQASRPSEPHDRRTRHGQDPGRPDRGHER